LKKQTKLNSYSFYLFQGLDDTLLSLNLEENRLVSVPVDSLSSLSNLQSLSLAYNSLKRLEMSGPQSTDDSIQMKALTKLDLSFSKAERTNICQLLDLAPKLEHLVYLGNSANQLACIENNNIQSLELGFNDNLESLDPAVFYSMSRLKSLSIQNCPQLDKIAVDTLMANTRLEEINITSNLKLETISLEVFSHLPSLRILNLSKTI
jgi:Leucine-rich repeat (LRR) protein